MLKDITPQAWLIGVVVIIAMVVSSICIVSGIFQGKYEAVTVGIGIMTPILSAFGVYQVTKK
jgi:hypothetical protein